MSSTDPARNAFYSSVPNQSTPDEEIKDWSNEDNVEFGTRTHIRPWVREEFLNRWRNFGMNYTHGGGDSTQSVPAGQATNYDLLKASHSLVAMDSNDPEKMAEWDSQLYKGPKTSWARVCSNAIFRNADGEIEHEGFILGGDGTFHNTYGFSFDVSKGGGGGDAYTLLGYDINGNPHQIEESDYLHRPSPGVTSISSEDIEPGKNFRRTTINFTCWSPTQLDYLDPYFFQAGISVIVEWGWNTYPRDALFKLDHDGYPHIVDVWNNNKGEPTKYSRSPASSHLRNGQGNYGFALGMITGFSYTIRSDGGFDCTCQVSCMSEVGHMLMNQASREKKDDGSRFTDMHDFIANTLRKCIVGRNDVSANSNIEYADPEMVRLRQAISGEPIDQAVLKAEQEAFELARGRYFTFNMYNSSKSYYAGKDNQGGAYITVGYLIDIINLFYERNANSTDARIIHFSCFATRCVAHPNIKSINGDVLLIPNSLAPRWNRETFHGSTINPRGNRDGSMSVGYQQMIKGSDPNNKRNHYNKTSENFLNILKQMAPDKISDSTTLEQAMRVVPRDDLHRILSVKATAGFNLQHPSVRGKTNSKTKKIFKLDNIKKVELFGKEYKEGFETREQTVRPFPDYMKDEKTGLLTNGYSGRIADLFVNLNIVEQEIGRTENISIALLNIMKQVSAAAGNLWDFDLMGGDTNTSSNTILRLVDRNYTGATTVKEQKESAWVFPTHRGDSFVRDMSLSVEPKSELSSMIVFGNLDKKNGFYSREEEDLILKDAINPAEGTTKNLQNSNKTKPEIPDSKKYIVAGSSKFFNIVYNEKNFPSYKADDQLEGEYDISYTNRETGKREVLKGTNKSHRAENIETAKKLGKESSIKTKQKLSSVQYGDSIGPGPAVRKKIFQILVSGDWVNEFGLKPGESGSENTNVYKVSKGAQGMVKPTKYAKKGTTEGNTNYPERLKKYLVGKIITYKYNRYKVMIDDGFSRPKTDKKYKIISATMLPGVPDNARFPYEVHLEELSGEETTLSDSYLMKYNQKKKQLGDKFKYPDSLPDKLKKVIQEKNLSKSDLDRQQLQYINTHSARDNQKNMSTFDFDVKIRDEDYGTTHTDRQIDIELVDTNKNRMLKWCESDENQQNNVIHNQRLDGVDLSITLDGIEGLRLFDVFNCTGIPSKYVKKGIFAIQGVKHNIENGDWSTEIDGMFVPGGFLT